MMMGDGEGEGEIIPMKDHHPSTIAVDGGKGSPDPLPTRRERSGVEVNDVDFR